jgi:hypothetical protein
MIFNTSAIKYGDAKKRGSTPAQYMHDWQLVSMELRDKAVDTRKRHREIYMLEQEAMELEEIERAEMDESSEDLAESIDELAGLDSSDEEDEVEDVATVEVTE